jgi:hypothetical protein
MFAYATAFWAVYSALQVWGWFKLSDEATVYAITGLKQLRRLDFTTRTSKMAIAICCFNVKHLARDIYITLVTYGFCPVISGVCVALGACVARLVIQTIAMATRHSPSSRPSRKSRNNPAINACIYMLYYYLASKRRVTYSVTTSLGNLKQQLGNSLYSTLPAIAFRNGVEAATTR